MEVNIKPSKVQGTITANASKSHMQRVCAAALITNGKTIIYNPGNCNDDLAAIELIKNAGANVYTSDGKLIIESNGLKNTNELTVTTGESGLGIRMFTPILATLANPVVINGEGSLRTRPMDFFDEIMPQLDVQIKTQEGKVPLIINGPLQPKNITIDGSLSSQFLTGLLMAYSKSNAAGKTITVTNLKSKPYVDLTLAVMKEFGLDTPKNNNYQSFEFEGGYAPAENKTIETTIEGDWSGAAFILVAGAIAGNVRVNALYNSSKQADKKIIDALLDAGAKVHVDETSVTVEKNLLKSFVFDANECPDLFPPLVVLAAFCNGITVIRGLKRLKHKESDRGLTLQEEFAKLNVPITFNGDEMHVHGGNLKVLNHTLNSHHDHRIAMAGAIATLGADFETTIRNADAVNKSYPDFYSHLESIRV